MYIIVGSYKILQELGVTPEIEDDDGSDDWIAELPPAIYMYLLLTRESQLKNTNPYTRIAIFCWRDDSIGSLNFSFMSDEFYEHKKELLEQCTS